MAILVSLVQAACSVVPVVMHRAQTPAAWHGCGQRALPYFELRVSKPCYQGECGRPAPKAWGLMLCVIRETVPLTSCAAAGCAAELQHGQGNK